MVKPTDNIIDNDNINLCIYSNRYTIYKDNIRLSDCK